MAKKKIEEPVYPVAPLKINREKFSSLLKEQITKGDELLKVAVPMTQHSDPYAGFGYMPRSRDKVYYQEDLEKKFEDDFKRWHDRNKAIYRSSFIEPENIYFHEYEVLCWRIWGSDTVKEYKENIKRLSNHMQGDIERVDLIECVAEVVEPIIINQPKELSHEIFIVHGHSEEMKQSVARIVTKLGLTPIILHEQPNGGKTIIEKFESNAESIRFAIILLSADDLGSSVRDLDGVKDEEVRQHLEMRARQNVVFEMGYFAGRLGRSHVFLLLQDGVAKPGDLDGIVYTAYDAAHAWRFELVKELKNAGYKVSADQVL